MAFTKDDIMRGIELAVMTMIGLLLLLFAVRPLIRRIITPELPGKAGALPAPSSNLPSLESAQAAVVDAEQQVAISSHTSQMIDIAQVQGQVHAQSVQKVGEMADKNPQEAVAIIRHWLHDAA